MPRSIRAKKHLPSSLTGVTVAVPPSLVNKGYQVRVGAHSWDNASKRRVTRLARVSLLFDIAGLETRVAKRAGQ